MKKYQYKREYNEPDGHRDCSGLEGWEMYSVIRTADDETIYFYKREITRDNPYIKTSPYFNHYAHPDDVPTTTEIRAANAAKAPKPTPALIPLYIIHQSPRTLIVRDNKNPVGEYEWGFSFTKIDTGEEKEVTLYGAQKWLDSVHPGKFYITQDAAKYVKTPEKITAYWHNHDGDARFYFRWYEGESVCRYYLFDCSYHATLEQMEKNWPGRYNFAVGACPKPATTFCTSCRKYGDEKLGEGCPGECEIIQPGNSVDARP